MEGCIFCKIVKGDAPSMKVFEDEFTLAFMDIAGDIDGHILVIPKEHCKNILDCSHERLRYRRVWQMRKVIAALSKSWFI